MNNANEEFELYKAVFNLLTEGLGPDLPTLGVISGISATIAALGVASKGTSDTVLGKLREHVEVGCKYYEEQVCQNL